MTLSNHMLTGAALGKLLPLPVAIPAALVSHFVLDALPHFGFSSMADYKKHKIFVGSVIITDFIVAVLISIWLIASNKFNLFIIGLIAFSPDFVWIYRVIRHNKYGEFISPNASRFVRFHSAIQKYERAWGLVTEIPYGVIMALVIR